MSGVEIEKVHVAYGSRPDKTWKWVIRNPSQTVVYAYGYAPSLEVARSAVTAWIEREEIRTQLNTR